MGYLRTMLGRAKALLASMPPSQRYSVAVLFAAVVVSLVMLVAWSGREAYAPVLTDLTGPQMTAIQDALQGAGYDHRFSDSTLFVAGAQREALLMELTEKGALPTDISSSFGFEDLVAPRGFQLKTAEQQQMEFNIALGNMLARAISTAPEISSAQVHIASSRDGYFGPFTSTAAVNITPHGSGRMSEEKFAAICRLVASAAGPQLAPEDVVVTNMVSGEAYSIGDGGAGFATASTRIELQETLNRYYSGAVEKFLEPVLGRVQILINVEVDTRRMAMTEVEFDWTVRSTSETSEITGGSGAADTLVSPNTGTTLEMGGGSGGGSSETTEKDEERAPAKTVQTEIPPGEVVDIQISVLADLARVEGIIRRKEGLEDDAVVAPERLAAEYEHYEAILQKGLPLKASDASNISRVSFRALPFGEFPVLAASVADVGSTGRVLDMLLSNWQAIALVFLAVVALFMMKSVATGRSIDEAALAALEKSEPDDNMLLPDVAVNLEEMRSRKIRESIEDMVKRDPQVALGLIKRWIARES